MEWERLEVCIAFASLKSEGEQASWKDLQLVPPKKQTENISSWKKSYQSLRHKEKKENEGENERDRVRERERERERERGAEYLSSNK